VGEVVLGGTPQEQARWARYESVLNHAFAELPAWVVCPYDVVSLPGRIVEDARRTHPTVWQGRRSPSDRYRPPREFLATIPEPVPDVRRRPAIELRSVADVASLREAMRRLGERIAMAPERLEDLRSIVGEIGANAILHGGGVRWARAWVFPDQLVCEIANPGGDPVDELAGLTPPVDVPHGGMGLWIARQLAAWLGIEPSPGGGTIVRFGVDRS
jgi:anti-sigma regulatory factor (Ser/Thr protein kinase)